MKFHPIHLYHLRLCAALRSPIRLKSNSARVSLYILNQEAANAEILIIARAPSLQAPRRHRRRAACFHQFNYDLTFLLWSLSLSVQAAKAPKERAPAGFGFYGVVRAAQLSRRATNFLYCGERAQKKNPCCEICARDPHPVLSELHYWRASNFEIMRECAEQRPDNGMSAGCCLSIKCSLSRSF